MYSTTLASKISEFKAFHWSEVDACGHPHAGLQETQHRPQPQFEILEGNMTRDKSTNLFWLKYLATKMKYANRPAKSGSSLMKRQKRAYQVQLRGGGDGWAHGLQCITWWVPKCGLCEPELLPYRHSGAIEFLMAGWWSLWCLIVPKHVHLWAIGYYKFQWQYMAVSCCYFEKADMYQENRFSYPKCIRSVNRGMSALGQLQLKLPKV